MVKSTHIEWLVPSGQGTRSDYDMSYHSTHIQSVARVEGGKLTMKRRVKTTLSVGFSKC